MQYLAMLYGNEADMPAPGTPERDAMHAAYANFGQKHHAAILGGEALLPSSQAVTVRAAATGAPLVTEGPFAETAEVIGGFYVLDAPTLDAAIDMARDIPMASHGAVEVRPLVMWMADNYLTPSAPGSRYLGLIVGKPTEADVPDTPEWDDGAAAHGGFVARAGDAVLGGGALHPTTTSSTVRVRNDEVLVTDGPFAESAEVVGGFYLLRGPDRDTVTALAAQIPVNPGGAIELWRVMDLA
jgi:hypothetical protein